MAPFDAELYLRLLGERELINRLRNNRNGRGSDLVEAARVLVAMGAVERELATEVIDGYALAAGLREGRGMWHRRILAAHAQPQAPAPVPEPASPRIVVCNETFERAGKEIHVGTVTLSESATKFTVIVRAASAAPSPRLGRMRPGPVHIGGGFNFTVSDDRGGRATTQQDAGGGNDREWQGHLSTDKPLAVDTAWIEFDGVRIDLAREQIPCAVSVEPVPVHDGGAYDYLWFWMASHERHAHNGIDGVIDALVAAGVLNADDPQLETMRELASQWRPWIHMPNNVPAGFGELPEQWRSLLKPRLGAAVTSGTVPMAATTPRFDGFRLTVCELRAEQGSWELQFEIAPGILFGPFSDSLDARRIAWWAVDDLGQHYLGQTNGSSGGPNGTSGSLGFQPALNRRAKTLTLLPTGFNERARIEFPLTWSTA